MDHNGVKLIGMGDNKLRLVTHLDYTSDHHEKFMNLNRNSVQRDQKKRLRARNIIFSLILGITFIFNSSASNNVYSQTEITISVEDTSIIDVLDEIEANTKLRFIFDSSIYNFNQ